MRASAFAFAKRLASLNVLKSLELTFDGVRNLIASPYAFRVSQQVLSYASCSTNKRLETEVALHLRVTFGFYFRVP